MNNEYTYICQEMISYSSDISLFKLLPVSSKINYRPGQYVEARLNNGTILPLSIANISSPDGLLEFHLRHDSAHKLAQQFIKELIEDKKVLLCGPKGECILDKRDHAKSLLFLAGGTGFTPIKALLEEALFLEQEDLSIQLYWGVRQPQDAYKETLLKQWQEKFAFFKYCIVLSEPEHFPQWSGATGLVHEYVANTVGYFEDVCVFASGPYPMIKAAQTLFHSQGLPLHHFISDMA